MLVSVILLTNVYFFSCLLYHEKPPVNAVLINENTFESLNYHPTITPTALDIRAELAVIFGFPLGVTLLLKLRVKCLAHILNK